MYNDTHTHTPGGGGGGGACRSGLWTLWRLRHLCMEQIMCQHSCVESTCIKCTCIKRTRRQIQTQTVSTTTHRGPVNSERFKLVGALPQLPPKHVCSREDALQAPIGIHNREAVQPAGHHDGRSLANMGACADGDWWGAHPFADGGAVMHALLLCAIHVLCFMFVVEIRGSSQL